MATKLEERTADQNDIYIAGVVVHAWGILDQAEVNLL